MQGHVVVGHVIAVGICEVEGGLWTTTAQANTANLEERVFWGTYFALLSSPNQANQNGLYVLQ